jgi:hypothetical protein
MADVVSREFAEQSGHMFVIGVKNSGSARRHGTLHRPTCTHVPSNLSDDICGVYTKADVAWIVHDWELLRCQECGADHWVYEDDDDTATDTDSDADFDF